VRKDRRDQLEGEGPATIETLVAFWTLLPGEGGTAAKRGLEKGDETELERTKGGAGREEQPEQPVEVQHPRKNAIARMGKPKLGVISKGNKRVRKKEEHAQSSPGKIEHGACSNFGDTSTGNNIEPDSSVHIQRNNAFPATKT